MRREPRVMRFGAQDTAEVLAAIGGMKKARAGWVNMSPAVAEEDLPADARPKLWSARGPLVPLCTWTPPASKGADPPVLVGIQHGAGGKARPRLGELGVAVPEAWRVQSDHTRRGIVVAVPASEDDAVVLRWLLRAGGALCDLSYSEWIADIYPPG